MDRSPAFGRTTVRPMLQRGSPMPIVTLVGRTNSKEGNEFVYIGPCPECKNCKIKNACINLDKGRKYRVVKVRDKEHECELHEGGVIVVEVEETPFTTTVDSHGAIENSTFNFEPFDCPHYECLQHGACFPDGLVSGKVKIISADKKNVECAMGKNLKVVTVNYV